MKKSAPLVFLGLLNCATPVAAHAFLQHATPGAGATPTAAPREIMLQFSEPLEPVFSGMTVTDAAGHDVEAGRPVVSLATMRVPLKPLAAGAYKVIWHVVSLDTHRTEGKFTFSVK